MAERRIAITKKVSLAPLSEGWDDCFAVVRLATYKDYHDFANSHPEKLDMDAQLKLEFDFVRDHFISGQIKTFDDANQPQLVDMQVDDIEASVELANLLFYEILGVKPDPKASLTTTATS